MTTLAALTTQTLNILYGLDSVERPIEDRLNGAIDNSTETIAVDTAAMWNPDDFAEFVNGEVIRLISDTVAKRGQRGTTAQAQADNADMVKNPPFLRQVIEEQITAAVRNDLWPHVWTWHQNSLTPSIVDDMYDLDAWVEEVVLVYQENIDADEKWRSLPPGWWDVERQIDAAVATNKNLLIVRQVHDYDEPVYYTAKLRPEPSTAGLTALADGIAEMVPWSTAARCLAFKSPQVKNAATRSRKDQEGGYLRDYRALMSEFIRQRDELNRSLVSEVREDKRWRGAVRSFGRSW